MVTRLCVLGEPTAEIEIRRFELRILYDRFMGFADYFETMLKNDEDAIILFLVHDAATDDALSTLFRATLQRGFESEHGMWGLMGIGSRSRVQKALEARDAKAAKELAESATDQLMAVVMDTDVASVLEPFRVYHMRSPRLWRPEDGPTEDQ